MLVNASCNTPVEEAKEPARQGQKQYSTEINLLHFLGQTYNQRTPLPQKKELAKGLTDRQIVMTTSTADDAATLSGRDKKFVSLKVVDKHFARSISKMQN